MSSFHQMPDDARVWIYASGRPLQQEEENRIRQKAAGFFHGWTAHQVPVESAFDIIDHLFLVIMVDEQRNGISGCGIDKSVAFVREVAAETGIDFFNRLQVEVVGPDKELLITDKAGVQSLLDDNKISELSVCYNKLTPTKADFDKHFKIPVKDSWFYKQLRPGTFSQ